MINCFILNLIAHCPFCAGSAVKLQPTNLNSSWQTAHFNSFRLSMVGIEFWQLGYTRPQVPKPRNKNKMNIQHTDKIFLSISSLSCHHPSCYIEEDPCFVLSLVYGSGRCMQYLLYILSPGPPSSVGCTIGLALCQGPRASKGPRAPAADCCKRRNHAPGMIISLFLRKIDSGIALIPASCAVHFWM